jgi:hypothetical protein
MTLKVHENTIFFDACATVPTKWYMEMPFKAVDLNKIVN